MVLSASRTMDFKMRTDPRGDIVELPVAAGTTIYSGALVGMLATGYVQPYVATTVATTLTGFDRLIGVALEEVVNAGAAGLKTVKVLISGCFYSAVSGLAITDVGAPVYASADDTLTKVALGNEFVGWVERYESSGYGMIRLGGPQPGPIFNRVTPAMTVTAANIALLVHPTENQNGLLVWGAYGLVTTLWAGGDEDQAQITLKDTAGTTLGIVLTGANGGAAVGTLMVATKTVFDAAAAAGDAIVIAPAGLGIQAVVTQVTAGAGAAGAAKVGVIAAPIA